MIARVKKKKVTKKRKRGPLPKSTRNRDGKGQGGVVYPWVEWFDRGMVVLEHGKHFHCLPNSFQQLIRRAGAKFGYKTSAIFLDPQRVKLVAQPGRSRKIPKHKKKKTTRI